MDRLSPRAARLFQLLGLHPGPHTSAAAAASLAALPLRDARSALDELARAHLVDEPAPGLFAAHDLLRGYARELAESLLPGTVRQEATHRLLDHYLHTAQGVLHTMRRPVSAPDLAAPRAHVVLELPATAREAGAWAMPTSRSCWPPCPGRPKAGLDTHAWALAWCLTGFLEAEARWQSMVEIQQTALSAARRLGDRVAQALSERALGYAHGRMGDLTQGLRYFTAAAGTFRAIGYRAGRARSHQGAAWVLGLLGRHPEGHGSCRQALDAMRDSPDHHAYANALNTMGRCHACLGRHEHALACCRQALALHQQSGDRLGEAESWYSIGLAHQTVGEHTQALAAQRNALDLFEQLGDRHYIAETLAALADAHDALGARVTAADLRCRALPILQDIRHPDAGRVQLLAVAG
ncbi:tetratricopeptide repeat protein [Streptacidiphilus sp. 4-A2]|nr:tetratricopeptide repeat protein [Streptacidiphilus sp. 4-A2]